MGMKGFGAVCNHGFQKNTSWCRIEGKRGIEMNNHIIIAGRLGVDPEVRFTSSGQKVTTFRMASNSRRGGKDETTWWRITVWGEQFDRMIGYFKKGSAIIVMGELAKPEIFTDREGRPQVSLNVTASNLSFSPFGKSDRAEEGRSQGDGQNQHQQQQQQGQQGNSEEQMYQQMMQGNQEKAPAFSDDEIPF